MSRASTPTLMSLQHFAKLMGIPAVHFAGGYGETVWKRQGACEELWPQYGWQAGMVTSREDLAQALADAEEEITRALGYSPAPRWFSAEELSGPIRGDIQTHYGKIIQAGRRTLSEIALEADVVFSDSDGDGWEETATITVATNVSNVHEIKLYFAGHAGAREWEIRPLRSISLSGGIATIVVDSWLLIDPNLWETYPLSVTGKRFNGINIETTVNYVTVVDVYREYTNPAGALTLHRAGGVGVCDVTTSASTQDGDFTVVDRTIGVIRSQVEGTFDSATVWYYAGERSSRFLGGETLEPLSDYWAQAITWLAVARLELPPCACGPAKDLFDLYRNDRARVDRKQGLALIAFDLVNNPFGTRYGEIRAWERVMKMTTDQRIISGAI